MKKSQIEFPVSIYGNVEKYNDIFSKARCRVFYKGANRNGTYITDEFAEELISTFQYIPVKGIHDGEDFTDHGEKIIIDDEGIKFECQTFPYGFVSPDAQVWFQDFEDF